MTQPTLDGFTTRYPDFACVDHALIEAVLAEAALLTDESWGPWEEMGAMLYTAHTLAIQGKGDGPIARTFKVAPIKSHETGSHKVTYQDVPKGQSRTGEDLGAYSLTPYGRQFESLISRFSVGFAVVQ